MDQYIIFKLLVAVAADSVSRGGVSGGVSSDDEKFQMASDKEIIKQLLLPGLDGYSGSEYHTLIYATMRVNGTLLITRSYPTFSYLALNGQIHRIKYQQILIYEF